MIDPSRQSIILIGFRATGKTTVGRLLAKSLGWSFIDIDELLEASFGSSIAAIFAAEGESGFRDREAFALHETCSKNQCVIATGGGAILREQNRKLLRSSGYVVWLASSAETIWSRLQSDPTTSNRRPNLTAAGGLAEVRALLAERDKHYRATAHLLVDADVPSPETVAIAILRGWTGHHTCPSQSGASGSSSSA